RIYFALNDLCFSLCFKYANRIFRDFMVRKKYAHSSLASLQIEEMQLAREYKAFMAHSVTDFQGKKNHVSLVVGKLNSSDPSLRKEAFFSYWEFIRREEKTLQNFFDKLLENRRQQAKRAQASSYVPLAFAELGRTDYTPEDCAQFRNSILRTILPHLQSLLPSQLSSLEASELAPWNYAHWPDLSPASPPAYGNMDELFKGMKTIVNHIHPSFAHLFEKMLSFGLIDIKPRAAKAPGAFSVTFHESKMPFLFGNFAANFKDAITFLHEFGHSIHGFAVSQIENILVRHPGYEFCEVASQGLELLASPFFKVWWPREGEGQKALGLHLFHMLSFWPFMAMVDEWQHRIYSAENFVEAQERNRIWKELSRKYKPWVNWGGMEELEELGWFSRPHLFTSPFYFIDYGIAQLGAIQIWLHSKEDYQSAVHNYIRAISLGAQRSLPELFAAAQLDFCFSDDLLNKLASKMVEEIKNSI
ncbi:MAG: hypothetical protein K2X39_09360, partial [Silvanigrellaceae bacterium]|nr:hypothetical protein [Silvanigrellaceae bacterium]